MTENAKFEYDETYESAKEFAYEIKWEIRFLEEDGQYDEAEELYNKATYKMMSYKEVSAFLKTHEDCEDVFWIIPIKKAYLENLLSNVQEEVCGYSDAYREEDIKWESERQEALDNVTSVKAFKQWLKDYDVCGRNFMEIWKGNLVSCM